MRDRRRFQLVGAVCAALAMIVSTGAPAAQLPTGAQDLSAVWWATAYNPRIRPIEGGELPFTEAGAELYRKNMEDLRAGRREDAARVWCVYDGIPRIWQAPYPFQIIQTPGQTTIVYETNQSFRIIEMDKALPKDDDLLPNFFANSVGRWEGGTLVVESKGYKDSSFIDATGVPVSDHVQALKWYEQAAKRGNRKAMNDLAVAFAQGDGTGRAQTVDAAHLPRFHALIAKFGALTGVPILVNTSFNVNREPIVETPEDALWCFLTADLDFCALEDRLVTKAPGL